MTTYTIQFLDSTGSPVPTGTTVHIYLHGTVGDIAGSPFTTDAQGFIAANLTAGTEYDFITSAAAVPSGTFTAPATTAVALVTGPPGNPGGAGSPGTPGATGANGLNGHGSTVTTGPITVPTSFPASVTVPVTDGTAFPNGTPLYASDGTNSLFGVVTAGGGSASLTVLASSGTGTTITGGATVTFTGLTGPTGATGPSGGPTGPQGNPGSNGNPGHGATTTTAAATFSTVGMVVVFAVVDPGAFPVYSYALVTDGTNVVAGQVVAVSGLDITVNPVLISGTSPMASGATMTFFGLGAQGATGATGPTGSTGPTGPGPTTTTASINTPSSGTTGLSLAVTDTSAYPVGEVFLVSDEVNNRAFYGQVTARSVTSGPGTLTFTGRGVVLGTAGQSCVAPCIVAVTALPGLNGSVSQITSTDGSITLSPSNGVGTVDLSANAVVVDLSDAQSRQKFVVGAVTAGSTSGALSIASGIFSSPNYVALVRDETAGTLVASFTTKTATSIQWTAVSGHVYSYFLAGS